MKTSSSFLLFINSIKFFYYSRWLEDALVVKVDAFNFSVEQLTLPRIRATVRFTDSVKGYAFSYDVPCPTVGGGASGAPFTFSGAIFPGTYRVTVAGGLSNLPTVQYVAITTLVVP